MMNSESRKRLEDRANTELLDEDLLETEARLRQALRELGAENPLRLSVGLARTVHDWIDDRPAVLCSHDYPDAFAAKWDELMNELGEWRRGDRTVC